jgi:hypothetical protein
MADARFAQRTVIFDAGFDREGRDVHQRQREHKKLAGALEKGADGAREVTDESGRPIKNGARRLDAVSRA